MTAEQLLSWPSQWWQCQERCNTAEISSLILGVQSWHYVAFPYPQATCPSRRHKALLTTLSKTLPTQLSTDDMRPMWISKIIKKTKKYLRTYLWSMFSFWETEEQDSFQSPNSSSLSNSSSIQFRIQTSALARVKHFFRMSSVKISSVLG